MNGPGQSHTRPYPPGAVLMEQNDEWTEARRYIGAEILAKTGTTPAAAADAPGEVNAIEAISA